jgi:fumarate reductase subunit C
MGQRHYMKFILRELSSVAVALFVIMTLLFIRALSAGPDAYARYMHRLAAPWIIAVSVIGFCFVLLHTITWFNLAPQAMAVRVRGKRVPEFLVAAPNYALWIVASIAVAWIVLKEP